MSQVQNIQQQQDFQSPQKQFGKFEQPPQQFQSPMTQKKQQQEYTSPSSMLTRSTLERELEELRIRLEARFFDEIEKWKARFVEADTARTLLQKENAQLHLDLQDAIMRIQVTEKDKEEQLILKESMHQSHAEHLKKSMATEGRLKNFEIERMKNALAERDREVEQWKSRCANAEATALAAQGSENAAREQQQRINILLLDIQERNDQILILKRRISELEHMNSNTLALEQQIRDLRGLLDWQKKELDKVKEEKNVATIEGYRSRQRELEASQHAKRLETHKSVLENQLQEKEKEKQQKVKELEDLHQSVVKKQQDDHHQEREKMRQTIYKHEEDHQEKDKKHQELSKSLHKTAQELENEKRAKILAQSTAELWQERCKSTEIQKAKELDETKKSHAEQVQRLAQDHSEEKDRLVQKIIEKEDQLQQTEEQRQNLFAERQKLNNELEDFRQLSEIKEKQYQATIQEKEESLKRLSSQAKDEQEKLGQRINLLSELVDQKRKEADEQRLTAAQLAQRAAEKERLAQLKELEANKWRETAVSIEREKSAEIIAREELNRSKLEALQRSHVQDIINKEQQSDALRHLLVKKEDEVQFLKRTADTSVREASIARIQADKAKQDSEFWKYRTLETEKKKNLELAVTEDLYKQKLERERRALLSESLDKSAIVRELSSEIEKKNRQLAIQESLSNSRLIEQERFHNMQEARLATQIGVLEHQLVKKDFEATDWRYNYQRLASRSLYK